MPLDLPGASAAGRQPLTVLIPTYNEEDNLPDCLASVAWADEILVVDSFSKDRTVAIATAAGARVLSHEYRNSAAQKNWAIPHCTHRWVLVVDADERVTPELAKEIQGILAGPSPTAAAFVIPRQNWLFGVRIRYSGWQSDQVTRLFDKEKARYKDLEVHSDLEVKGIVGRLTGTFQHHTYRTYDQYLEKSSRYTTWAANDLWKRGKRARFHHFFLRVPFRFWRTYLLKLGILDGVQGLQISWLGAHAVFMKYAKLQAMEQALQQGKRDAQGRLMIHAGAAIQENPEIIGGGRPPTQATAATPT